MKQKSIVLKSIVCLLLAGGKLGNCEKQLLTGLVGLLDEIILDSLVKVAKKEKMTVNSYIIIKFLEINNILKGYKNSYTVELINMLDSFVGDNG